MQKTLEQLSLEELASIHLDIYDTPKSLAVGYVRSCIGGLITEIQQSRGLMYTRIFSPLYGSFALLDQIGSCYVNKSIPPCPNADASGIKKALYYFCNMPYDSEEMKALYGLRNSLMHDGSILYRGRYNSGKWSGPYHHFILGSDSQKIVDLPSIPWDGDLKNLTCAHRTRINQRAFTDLAIDAVKVARQLLGAGNLGFSLKEGEIELYYRYLFHQLPAESDDSDVAG
ncbi:hypothetical protein [Stenotrophomonas riyadhensis]|uniref:hypothetical protein n=1 Tax=Stenotrophomonas riyadhensis TaxID=2859893 RepID=UPI0033065DA3